MRLRVNDPFVAKLVLLMAETEVFEEQIALAKIGEARAHHLHGTCADDCIHCRHEAKQ